MTQEMKEYFTLRTRAHLFLVRKWSDKISSLNDYRIDRFLLDKERDEHDQYKWVEPEYTPYVYITWMYKCRREGVPFEIPEDIKNSMNEATFHHIKNNAHHPEFWDKSFTINDLNKDDRDRPTGGRLVDGTMMPMTYIAAMVADWCAMSEELETNSPKQWAESNINIRWKFSREQIDFIYYLIDQVWT